MTFRLDDEFVEQYRYKEVPWGFNGLGYIVYLRTYARTKDDGTKESWWETVRRVVEGTYSMQKRHIQGYGLGWEEAKGQKSAREMYDRMFHMKFLPPGRGIWAMGSPITEEKGLFAALNNCGFVSTKNMAEDPAKPFRFLMDMSMLGVGVGFDIRGADDVLVKYPSYHEETFVVPDTREGWVESVGVLLESFFYEGGKYIAFDYSEVRAAGEPIKTFGGVSSGPGPLKKLHEDLRSMLYNRVGRTLSGTDIVDIMNMIGCCVVSGNVRRSAEIVFGPHDNEKYMSLKDYEVNPHRSEFGWASNNSIFAPLGMDYSSAADRTRKNGEPGFAWLENMRAFSRMGQKADWKDHKVAGGNPCLEQSLESYELCCLVETFPQKHDDMGDYLRTLKFAYLYAKSVTLGNTHWAETNRVLLRNRRIGCSPSGVAQFLSSRGIHDLRSWLEAGYEKVQEWDQIYSDWFAIPRSIKTTSVKPSGTVSLLAGSTPGMHYPESRYYIRRVRLGRDSDLVGKLQEAGYSLEPCVNEPERTMVVSVPVDAGEGVRSVADVSMWEQLSLAAFLQRHWADNQVSCTVTFDPEREGHDIENALNFFQYQLKGVSFLPRMEVGAYEQMPYEEITKEEYLSMAKGIGDLQESTGIGTETEVEKFCDTDHCLI